VSAFGLGLLLAQVAGAVPPLTAAAANVVNVSDRAFVQVRSVVGGPAAIDLDEGITATLRSTHHDTVYNLGYAPHLAYLDIEGARSLALMHNGRAAMVWTRRRLRLNLALDGSYGNQSSVSFLSPTRFADAATGATGTTGGTVPVPAPLPTATAIYVPLLSVISSATFRASGALSYNFSRRWLGSADGYYALAGGLDYYAQQAFPPSRGPGGGVTLTYAASARDQLATRADASYVYVLTTRAETVTADVTETIRHTFSKHLRGAIGGGLTYVVEDVPAVDVAAVNPGVATAALTKSRGFSGNGTANLGYTKPIEQNTALTLNLAAQYGSTYNPVLGVPQQVITGVVSSSWTRPDFILTAAVDGSDALPSGNTVASKVVAGSVVTTYSPVRALQLQLGVRLFSQVLPRLAPTAAGEVVATAPTDTGLQWTTFLAVTVLAPALEL
jgi:hypothetical protein